MLVGLTLLYLVSCVQRLIAGSCNVKRLFSRRETASDFTFVCFDSCEISDYLSMMRIKLICSNHHMRAAFLRAVLEVQEIHKCILLNIHWRKNKIRSKKRDPLNFIVT